MNVFNEAISDDSVWLVATPNEFMRQLPFYITEIGHFSALAEYRVTRDYHDSLLFIYTVNGSGEVTADGKKFELPRGRACVIDCRKSHEYHSKTERWEFYWLHFGGTAARPMVRSLHNMYGDKIKSAAMPETVCGVLENLISGIGDASMPCCLDASSEIHGIINKMFAAVSRGDADVPLHRDDIADAVDYIKQNYSRRISVNDVAEHSHMSAFYFSRLFHRVTGTSPYNYITVCRINRSKELLLTTDMKIAEIAEKCGFSDANRYIAQFKRCTAMTPAKYRAVWGV